jgi:hypothetical protein
MAIESVLGRSLGMIVPTPQQRANLTGGGVCSFVERTSAGSCFEAVTNAALSGLRSCVDADRRPRSEALLAVGS